MLGNAQSQLGIPVEADPVSGTISFASYWRFMCVHKVIVISLQFYIL